MEKLENHLSVITIKAIFFCLMNVFAALTIVTTIAQSFEIVFRTYAIWSLIITFVVFLTSIFVVKGWFSRVDQKDYFVLTALLIVGMLGALSALFINLPSADDYYYIPNAVYHLINPDQPMNYLIYYVWSGSKLFHSYTQATAVSYEYFQSLLSYFLHIPYLYCYYIISPAVIGCLVQLAYFLAISYFSDRSDDAVVGAMVVLGLMILLGGNKNNLANYSIARIYQGRSVLLTLAPPLFAAASLSYFTHPNFVRWFTVFSITTVFTRLSTTAVLFLPVLAVGLSSSFLVVNRSKNSIPILMIYFLSMTPLFLWALYILDESRSMIGGSNPLPLNTFWENLFSMASKHRPVYPFLAVLSSCLSILLTSGKQRIFLAVWMLSTIVVFFNPIVAPFWIHQLSSSYFNNVYWRLFFAYPFPFTAGITTVRIFERGRMIRAYGALGPGIALGVLLCVLLATFPTSILRSKYVWLDCCEYKLPPELLATAREIVSSVPTGVMLSPRKLSGIITTLNPRFQQMIIYKDALRLWSHQQGRSDEAETRIRAMEYLEGKREDLSSLETVVAENDVIRSIVMAPTSLDNKDVALLLEKYGFIHRKTFGDNVVVWK